MFIEEFFVKNININTYIIFLIFSLTLTATVSLITNYLFKKYRILDIPNNRKSHRYPVPISGGTILVISLCIFIIIFKNIINESLLFYSNIIFLSFIFFLIGFFDDLKNPRTRYKIIVIILLLLISLLLIENYVLTELKFKFISLKSISLGFLSIPFSIFCIFMFFNALNYSDGKNGICISYSIFLIIYLSLNNLNHNIFNFFIISSLIVLLIFNLNNKLFLGNGGVNFLSIFISLLIIKSYNLNEITIFCDEILLLMLIPGLDAARVTIYRLLKRVSPVKPDKKHLHHFMENIIHEKIIWIFYFLLSSLPILLLHIFGNFLISITLPILIYATIIFKFHKN